ncbi:MAG: hypothetical protein GVY24_07335 [Planctomycetes bacterium]|nr:hypothetical protein [Planctomycetota bacterium]
MRCSLCLVVVLLMLGALPARAQTSSALILVPWGDDDRVEIANSLWFGYDGNASNGGADVDLFRFSSVGRARPSAEDADWAVGWKYSHLDIDTTDAALPERLIDQAIAGGVKMGTFDRWEWGFVAGLGYAGNAPYNDGDAWYAVGSLAASTRLDNGATLTVLLDYDGNRNVLPDVPLPGVAYAHRFGETLRYTVGLPVNSVTWTPDARWKVRGLWVVPYGFGLDAEYALTDDWTLFGGYTSQTTGYHVQGDDENRRLFFEQDRVELGARWKLGDAADLVGAVGYAFDQSFERGYDTRDTDTIRDVSDEPFFRLALNFRF